MKDGKFLKKYRKEMKEIMKGINPKWDDDFLDKYILEFTKERVKNPVVTIDNNFTGENKTTSLLSVLDWTFERKPIIAGNATFYKNQYEAMNPMAKMLEGFLNDRKKYKKLMFKEEPGTWKYADYDRKQLNEKILANSYYGASGAQSSAFYCQWGSPCTTGSAQSVISTAEQLFEGFIGDNYVFLNLTEVIEWCMKVVKNFYKEDYIFDSFIQHHTLFDVKDRLMSKILNTEDNDDEILENFLNQYNMNELDLLYYKNNMIEFIKDHKEIQELFITIFENVENLEYAKDTDDWMKVIPNKYLNQFKGGSTYKDWNSFVDNQYFMDPNNVPDSIRPEVEAMSKYMMKYIYCKYLSMDRIYRLKNFERMTVTVIDTDSNILSLDTLVNFIFDEVLMSSSFGRSNRNNMFIIVNTFAYVMTEAVTDILLTYGEYSNIPEEFRPIYNMKNEFLFDRLIIGNTKKRYISRVLLREGNLMDPPKYDVKGLTNIVTNIFKRPITKQLVIAK